MGARKPRVVRMRNDVIDHNDTHEEYYNYIQVVTTGDGIFREVLEFVQLEAITLPNGKEVEADYLGLFRRPNNKKPGPLSEYDVLNPWPEGHKTLLLFDVSRVADGRDEPPFERRVIELDAYQVFTTIVETWVEARKQLKEKGTKTCPTAKTVEEAYPSHDITSAIASAWNVVTERQRASVGA